MNGYRLYDAWVAQVLGIPAAVMLYHIELHADIACNHNDGDGKFDGKRHWLKSSVSQFHKELPELSERVIRSALDKLVLRGLLIKRFDPDDPMDRTLWWAVAKEEQ